jgi:3-methyladenine DNA glycosylase AlkD
MGSTNREKGVSMSAGLERIRADLKKCADPARARDLQRFFKTGPGEYGAGDVFLGARVPAVRRLAGKYPRLPLDEAAALLRSAIHEERLLALCVLVGQYDRGSERLRSRLFRLYLENVRHVNNWDLVDVSAPHIVGRHLHSRSRAPLYRLARSRSLWKRRIAIMATFYFLRQGDFIDTFRLADLMLADREDLIHKAVGWMIREVGNRNRRAAEAFLRERYGAMPRTMLRYAIEKFPEPQRQKYLRGRI